MKIPILENGNLFVTQQFLTMSSPPAPDNPAIDYVGDGEEIDLDYVAEKLEGLRSGHNGEKPLIDGPVACLLHQSLRLARRDAANHRFWHYVAVVKCPSFVAWRHWDERENRVSIERYLGRWDGNALGRLWWWAEFTHESGSQEPYARTLRCSRSQEFMLHVVDNLLSGNSALVRALGDAVFGDGDRLSDQTIRGLFVRVNALLVTVAVDTLSEAETHALVQEALHDLQKE